MGEDMEEKQDNVEASTDTAADQGDSQPDFVRYVVIGEREDGSSDIMFSGSEMHIKDLLLYREVLQARIDSIIDPSPEHFNNLAQGMKAIYSSSDHIIAQLSRLATEIQGIGTETNVE
jgi:hypothetical protein